MAPAITLDPTDHAILDLLHRNARQPLTEIAAAVNLTPAPVKRRIHRLEAAGVITGYTVVVDHAKVGPALEAITELRIAGDVDASEVQQAAAAMPEVLEVFTTAGDPDLLLRLRFDDVAHLQRVIATLRRSGQVIGTKSLMVLEHWTRSTEPERPRDPH